MQTSGFDRAALPPPRTFYERELGRLSRLSRGWARGNCPFHKSKSGLSFSVHLDSGGFYCFGSGVKGGDLLAFGSCVITWILSRLLNPWVLGAWI